MRTQEEIVTRIRQELDSPSDMFGTALGDLVTTLDYGNAKEFIKPDITEEDWKEHQEEDADIIDSVNKYIPFALEKADNHRGLSAARSVTHFDAWIWLLKTDEELAAYRGTPYTNYGVPQVVKAAEIFGVREEMDSLLTDGLRRMATGLPCIVGCMEGCSR
jgi:hypothetical protein